MPDFRYKKINLFYEVSRLLYIMKEDSDGQLHLSRNHPYYAQVQGEMHFLMWNGTTVFLARGGRFLLR